jgi:hypothetical protein
MGCEEKAGSIAILQSVADISWHLNGPIHEASPDIYEDPRQVIHPAARVGLVLDGKSVAGSVKI